MSDKINRQVLKWLQSLDLAYSIKNPKRDFSNGFLVAEIYSRYYPKEIDMHNYENGIALRIKKDNWQQILLFFKKNKVPYDLKEIDDVTNCVQGSVIPFVNKMYTFLTQKEVRVAPVREFIATSPSAYKRSGSSAYPISARLDGSDSAALESMVSDSLHETEAMDDSGGRAKSPKILRGTTRTLGAEEKEARIQVSKVQVKAVDRSVSQIRASKDRSVSASSLPYARSSAVGSGGGSRLGTPKHEATSSSYTANESVAELFNSVVTTAMDEAGLADIFSMEVDVSQQFMSSLLAPHTPASQHPILEMELVNDVFKRLSDAVGAIVAIVIKSDKEFWFLLSCMVSLIRDLPSDSTSFAKVTELLIRIGESCVDFHPATSMAKFMSFGVTKLAALLKKMPAKRHVVLRIAYAFAPSDVPSHIALIRALKDELDDLAVFTACLAMCIYMEADLNEQILDLYLYYCVIGMGMTSPPLRASCLTMLSVIANVNVGIMVNPKGEIMQALKSMVDDTWWEVTAQLIVVSAALLNRIAPNTEAAVTLYDIVERVLGPSSSSHIKNLALSYLAKTTWHHTRLAVPLMYALLSLDDVSRSAILDTHETPKTLPFTGTSGSQYILAHIPSEWNGALMAKTLIDIVRSSTLEHLEVDHMQILIATLAPTTSGASASSKEWKSVFDSLQDYLFVALCDPYCAPLGAKLLLQYITGSDFGLDILCNKRFSGSLQLLFSDDAASGDGVCQGEFQIFFEEVWHWVNATGGGAHVEAAARLILDFASKFPDRVGMFPTLKTLVYLVQNKSGLAGK